LCNSPIGMVAFWVKKRLFKLRWNPFFVCVFSEWPSKLKFLFAISFKEENCVSSLFQVLIMFKKSKAA
jgi:hypothetical protein